MIVVDARVTTVVEEWMRCELERGNRCRDDRAANKRLDAELFGCPSRERRCVSNRVEAIAATDATRAACAAGSADSPSRHSEGPKASALPE